MLLLVHKFGVVRERSERSDARIGMMVRVSPRLAQQANADDEGELQRLAVEGDDNEAASEAGMVAAVE